MSLVGIPQFGWVKNISFVRLGFLDLIGWPLLHSEGYSRSSVRLDALERELNLKYNRGRHMLLWNRKVGKVIGSSDEGFIRCLKCKRQWRWKDRVNNLLRTTCIVSQSVHFTKRIRNKSSLSHVQDNLTVSPLWRIEAQIDVLPPDRVGVGWFLQDRSPVAVCPFAPTNTNFLDLIGFSFWSCVSCVDYQCQVASGNLPSDTSKARVFELVHSGDFGRD